MAYAQVELPPPTFIPQKEAASNTTTVGWPADLSVYAEPCLPRNPDNKTIRPEIRGGLDVTSGYGWRIVSLRGRAKILKPDGSIRTALSNSIGLPNVLPKHSEEFLTRFEPILRSEIISSCDVIFGGGKRIIQKSIMVIEEETPIARDKDCLDDLLAASELKGLELRKKIAELKEYGCVEFVPGKYRVHTDTRHTRLVNGKKFEAVQAIFDRETGAGPASIGGFTPAIYVHEATAPDVEEVNGADIGS
jgi:hypothetical protein